MPGIERFAVGTSADGRLEVVAIAGPGQHDPQFHPAIWQAQEQTDEENSWPTTWRSLGTPGDGFQFDGITMASNAGGGLEVAVLVETSTVWHARQDDPDGDWSGWTSLGNPVSGGSIIPPALVQNQDGRLELFTVSLLPHFSAWHRSQLQPGQDQWTGWSSLGWPAGQGQGPVTTGVAPAVAQNQDGRLEMHLHIGEQIWHSWQKTAGGHDWVPWESLGHPEDAGPVGGPTVALDVDSRLQVFAPAGPHVWVRGQHGPGLGPWDPWVKPGLENVTGEPVPAVAAQPGGRLVLFTLRNMPDGTQSLQKLEQEGGPEGLWLAGDPIETTLLGKADAVPKAGSPTLASDSRGRLRLFLSVPGTMILYCLNQANAGGGRWLEAWINMQAP